MDNFLITKCTTMEQTKEIRAYLSHQKKLTILKFVKDWKSVNKTLTQFRIPKSTYYFNTPRI